MSKHHVVPHGEQWAVKAEGSERASAVFERQDDAIAAAKKIAANQGGVVLIHRPDGTIRSERVERITGTITVDVESGESLDEVKRKIARADKRLKALAAAIAAKEKTSTRKAAKKPAAKNADAKTPAKKAAAKKPAAKKTPAKKVAVKKPAIKKAAAKKAPAKKAAVKKPPVKKVASKKPAVKKAAAKKATPKKPAAKKAAAKKPAARKSPAKKAAARKPAAKKAAPKKAKGFAGVLADASKAIRRLAERR
jgi:hypothetical protein